MEASNVALRNLIQGFRLSCQAEGKSPVTVTWYGEMLNDFVMFLALNNRRPIVDELRFLGGRSCHGVLYHKILNGCRLCSAIKNCGDLTEN